jgi:hypothetical protein
MISRQKAKLVLFGIILICVSHEIHLIVSFLAHSSAASQYCDGLRGAFILYDPDDPHKESYDVDDGMLSELI